MLNELQQIQCFEPVEIIQITNLIIWLGTVVEIALIRMSFYLFIYFIHPLKRLIYYLNYIF